MSVEHIINGILDREGEKFTNNPNDAGGPTKWGWTQAALSDYLERPATTLDVQNLTRQAAYFAYLKKYFTKPGFDKVAQVSQAIAEKLMDTEVNLPPGMSVTFMQRLLNALNLNGIKYPDLPLDGHCGPVTMSALLAYIQWRGRDGEEVLLEGIAHLQGEYYVERAEKRPANEEFLYGWLKNRAQPHMISGA